MKDLTIEEKAKAYDNLIERLKNFQSEYRFETIDKYFPELKESKENEDEKIKGAAIEFVRQNKSFNYRLGISKEEIIAWLEKQSEHSNFLSEIQIGDKVTRNEDGVLVNLSQLKRVAKKDEKQGEQKPAEWSKENEEKLDRIISLIHCYTGTVQEENELKTFLKSLKERYTWKPSELPHWKKSTLPNDNTTGFNSDYFCHNGYCINYKELFEKLPKDD